MMVGRLTWGVLLLVVALHGVTLAEALRESDVRVEPAWRFQARPYETFGSDLSLGVYHRLTGGWDLGCQISSRLSNQSSGGEEQGSLYSDDTRSAQRAHSRRTLMELDLDLRHWSLHESRWGWFVGPRVLFGYRLVQDEIYEANFRADEFDRISIDRDEDELTLGGGLVAGVEVVLFKQLSVGIALNPVDYRYSWSDSDETVRHEESGEAPRYRRGKWTGDRGALTTDLTPEALLILRIH